MASTASLKTELIAEKFYPTKKIVREWYEIINIEVFKNRLTVPKISVRRLRGTWAGYDGILTMTNWFPSKHIFLNVLAHEMIHVYQHQYEQPSGHGPSFWAWKKPFKRNGLYLSVAYYF